MKCKRQNAKGKGERTPTFLRPWGAEEVRDHHRVETGAIWSDANSHRLEIGATFRWAFTLIELLVVISIILVLLGAVIVAGPKLMDTGRSQTTQLMLVAVRDAIEEFKREQTEKPTLTRPLGRKPTAPCNNFRHYRDRFGPYPPDELEIFSETGLPFFCQNGSLAPGQAIIRPSPNMGKYAQPMKFYPDRTDPDNPEFRDNLALTLAIDLFGQSSKMMLEQIAANNRREVPPGTSSAPSVYLDVDLNNRYDADKDRTPYYLVDGWGVPISYFAQRDFRATPPTPTVLESSNHSLWGPASTAMVQRNGSQPVIVSYGPNGKEQLSKEVQDADARASMVGDWMEGTTLTAAQANLGVIDNPLNRDNVYADPIVKQRLESAP